MSPRGWPKGKPRGKATSEARRAADKKFIAAGARARKRRKIRSAEVASGRSFGGGLNEDFRPQRAHIDVTPAAWKSAITDIGDWQYVDDPLDDVLLRALDSRVVYASRPCCHHPPPFQDLTIEVIAAAERHAMKMEGAGYDPRKRGLPLPSKDHISKRPLSERQLTIIGLLACGFTLSQIGKELHIQERTAKMHCEILRVKLGVKTTREIPLAYRMKTGKDPFSLVPGIAPISDERAGAPLTAVVAEMFLEPRAGKPLLDVVSEMFDPS